MSYQYGTFVYGIPVPHDLDDFFTTGIFEEDLTEKQREELITEWEKDEPFGMQFHYSASGSKRDFGYLGIDLENHSPSGEDLDCWSPFRPKDLVARTPKPTDKQKQAACKLIDALPPIVKKLLPGKPDVWVIWGSS